MKKFICILLILALLAVLGYCLWQIVGITDEYQAGEQVYEELEQYIVMPETVPVETIVQDETIEAETAPVQIQWPEVDFNALAQVNGDIVGWLYIPGTVINYPVVQGEDNEYYLKHLFNGKTNSSGCIYLDCGAEGDFASMNSVLHGHHMKNGSMFAGICKYKDQSYFDEHPTAMLLTPDGNYQVEFFSGYVCEVTADAWDYDFDEAWLDKRIRSSYFDAEVMPTMDDRILTLSTCCYDFKDARFVLHGILVPA